MMQIMSVESAAQFALGVGGAVFGAGVAYATLRLQLVRERDDRQREDSATRKDMNGLGGKLRQDEGRAERRWKHLIAAHIEASTTLEEAKKYAELLRQDAYRD